MQTLAVAAAEHDTTRELVNDKYLPVLDDIVDVTLHYAVRTERLIYVVREGGVFDVGVVFEVERTLRLGDAPCGERCGAGLFVHDVVGVDILRFLLLGVGAGVHELL